MEPDIAMRCSERPVSDPYIEPDESSPYPAVQFFFKYILIFSHTPSTLLSFLCPSGAHKIIRMHFASFPWELHAPLIIFSLIL
jgi:hypothetical protein